MRTNHTASLGLLVAGIGAVTACSHAEKNAIATKDAATDTSGMETIGDLRTDPNLDGGEIGADMATIHPDVLPGSDTHPATVNRDAARDRAAREAAADRGTPPACTETLLLGGTLPASSPWGQSVLLADVNSDGKLDLVTESSVALVLFGEGDGTPRGVGRLPGRGLCVGPR